MNGVCLQVKQIPDLSLNKYQTLADTGVGGVIKRHSSFIRQWHGICMACNASMHLLYLFDSKEPMGSRLKLYLVWQGIDSSMVNILMKHSPLSDFYQFEESEFPTAYFKAGATLIKNERLAEIYNPLSGKERQVYYVPKWKVNEEGRLYDLFRIMEAFGKDMNILEPCAYRIDLYPVSMVQETRNQFTPVLKSLWGDNDIQLIKDGNNRHRDNYAGDIGKEYEDWLTEIETTPHFRANIYGFAQNDFQAQMILNAVGAESVSGGNFRLASIKPDKNNCFMTNSRMERVAQTYCTYRQQSCLPSWSTTFTLQEIEPFFRMPVLFEGESIELRKETAPDFYVDGICLGKDSNDFPVYFPLGNMSKHAFFTGMPGAGKTNTMLHMISEIQKYGIPFLVMEPAKKEYRELLCDKRITGVYLFSPHIQSRFPLRMNPFEFPRGVRLSEHINALLEVFQGSFCLEGPTYKFLSDSIQQAYKKNGWELDDINDEELDLIYPTLQDVYDNLEKEIEKSSYDGEMKGNVRAFLQVRLGGLMDLDAGELFDTSISTISPEKWLEISAIVELEVLGEQAKNFFVLLVCHYILETLRVKPWKSEKGKKSIRHVVFIEEAHNIIASSTEQSSSETVDPKISATAYIVKMLAEVRALCEAIVISDQLPTALADEVTKNTGLKLVHRLTSIDDREKIGSAISASGLQIEQMATFSKGQALIYHENTIKPFQVQVEKWNKSESTVKFSDDAKLFEYLHDTQEIQKAITVALNSWKLKFFFPWVEQALQYRLLCCKLANEEKNSLLSKLEIAHSKLVHKGKELMRQLEKMEKLWNRDGFFTEKKNEDVFWIGLDETKRELKENIESLVNL